MALFNLASDIDTRETILVSTNVRTKKQLNSHTSKSYSRDGFDGFPAWELAGLHTDYTGNNWEAKYDEFVAKWGEVV